MKFCDPSIYNTINFRYLITLYFYMIYHILFHQIIFPLRHIHHHAPFLHHPTLGVSPEYLCEHPCSSLGLSV